MEMRQEIIDYILKNRVSTTEVSDALGKSGVVAGVLPINSQMYQVGKVRCVFTANESNYDVHDQIRSAEAGEIVIVFTHNCGERAVFGELVSKYLTLYKRVAAVVVQGYLRDVAALKRERFPVWSSGVTPVGCFNRPTDPFPPELEKEIRAQYEGGVAICDEGGVVVIPPEKLNQKMLDRLNRIEMQEDIWFFCLDFLKWDTKKIVCDKAYLKDQSVLSPGHIESLAELEKPLDP